MDRRQFLARGAGAAAALAALPRTSSTQAVSAAPPPSAGDYARAIVIDALAPDGPYFDPKEAIEAGITAVVVDVEMYPRSFPNAVQALADWNHLFRRPESALIKATTAADIVQAKAERKLAVVLACQDAAILDSSTGSVSDFNLRNLGLFYDLGLRVLQLSHNERNGVGDGFREKTDAGLSRLGERIVTGMNGLGMLIDLSHCSTRTTLQAIELSTRPCAITHAGCRALHPTARNKTDEEIRAVAEKGGFFGVFPMSLWLTARSTASVDDVVDHIDHAVKVGGVEHVGFGSDGPVLAIPSLEDELRGHQMYAQRNLGLPGAERIPEHVRVPELNSPHRMERLAQALTRRGYSEDAVDGIIGGNLLRVLREVCG